MTGIARKRRTNEPEWQHKIIKDIFVDKYPEVVSLHGLDAGNLSLTLGYTQLRLRKGEVLPRAKRIFHVLYFLIFYLGN